MKITTKRLLLFIILSFAISWLSIYCGKWIFPDEEANTARAPFFNYIAMLGPALANILTRIITKEGFGHSLLAAKTPCSFSGFCSKKQVKYYWLGLFVPILAILTSTILMGIFADTKVSLQYSSMFTIGTILVNIFLGLAGIVIYFGEEFGWRAYLFPKLEELTNTKIALILTGFIWGLWHLPALLDGANFGKDLPYFPFSNILLMCILCTFIGTFYTLLTKNSGSVFPATIAHTVHDHVSEIIPLLLLPVGTVEGISKTENILCSLIPTVILGCISFLFITHKIQKKPSKM